MAIEHLDEQLLAPERRLERARLGHQRGSRGDELGDLRRARAQRAVELVVQLAAEQDDQAGAEHRQRHEDAEGGSQSDADA